MDYIFYLVLYIVIWTLYMHSLQRCNHFNSRASFPMTALVCWSVLFNFGVVFFLKKNEVLWYFWQCCKVHMCKENPRTYSNNTKISHGKVVLTLTFLFKDNLMFFVTASSMKTVGGVTEREVLDCIAACLKYTPDRRGGGGRKRRICFAFQYVKGV